MLLGPFLLLQPLQPLQDVVPGDASAASSTQALVPQWAEMKYGDFSHDELMARRGTYAQLYKLQNRQGEV